MSRFLLSICGLLLVATMFYTPVTAEDGLTDGDPTMSEDKPEETEPADIEYQKGSLCGYCVYCKVCLQL